MSSQNRPSLAAQSITAASCLPSGLGSCWREVGCLGVDTVSQVDGFDWSDRRMQLLQECTVRCAVYDVWLLWAEN